MTNLEIAKETNVEIYLSDRGDVVAATVSARERSAQDRLALAVATCGVGYMPFVPATWGSAATTCVYLFLLTGLTRLYAAGVAFGLKMPPLETVRQLSLLVLLIPLALAGIWAATRAERLLGRKDPKPVVIDEVVGQLMTFLFVPVNARLWMLLVGFFLFRLFDIWKPYPVRRLEALESGLGIMADDVLAGAYAATIMALLTLF